MTVLVAGCGDLGTEVGLRFAATGRRVYGLRRSPQKLPAQFTGIGLDLSREVPVIPPETETVVVATAADQRTEAAYRAAYVDGLRNLLDGLRRSHVRPRRFLLVSSTSVYGDAHEGWIDEDTAVTPSSATGAVLREAEAMLHQELPEAIVLRLTGLYGPGRTRLIDQVRAGSATATDRYTNRIHRDDAAAAIVHLTTMGMPPDSTYIGVDEEPATKREVVHFLARELGVEAPAAGEGPAGEPRNKRCRNDRLVGTGFRFRFPTYREGYRAILAGEGIRHP